MAKILGLSFFFHDSAAALVCDGQITAAVAEERFSRKKHTNEFPKLAIEYCLHAGNLSSIRDLDAIVFYEKPVLKLFRAVETLVETWPRSLFSFVRKLPPLISTKTNIYDLIRENLPGYEGPILFSEHHLSHAASAFYCSPFDRAAILTLDGVGEWETTTIGLGMGKDITLKYAIHFPHSIGLLYSALTAYLGFRVNDGEWKVMGLAPYGKPRYVDQFRKLVIQRADGSFRLRLDYFAHHYSSKVTFNRKKWEKLFGFSGRNSNENIETHHHDLACSGQAVVEELILNLARQARKISDCDHLVIAGGVGLNSVANWRIQQEGIFKDVWIQPAAGDDGASLGAALLASQTIFNDPLCATMQNAYFGPSYNDDEICSFLESQQIPYKRLSDDEIVSHTADLIRDNQVVGWFQGSMEFGPRSLGSRSILANPTNAEMKSIINQKIKFREYFRPFAPAVPVEHVHEYFDVPPGTDMPFMTKVPSVHPNVRFLIPAVTHEDGTGRVQTVRESDNKLFYRLLKTLKTKIGVPVALNTSFNVRGEPIVCSPEDAYNCFMKSGIDVLVMGNYLVTKEDEQSLDVEASYRRSDALEAGGEQNRMSFEIGTQTTVLVAEDDKDDNALFEETSRKVLNFYKELPFNYYSNSIDTTLELLKRNRLREYPPLHHYLKKLQDGTVLDVGCGAGWFVHSCAYYYGMNVIGIEINPIALKQAISVGRFFPKKGKVEFIETDLFCFKPNRLFDVVNSLGVLHHTPDCHSALRKALSWVKPGGYLHLGLYHLYGRKPFLEYFKKLRKEGRSEVELFEEFATLNPDITDGTHMMSWFRDQVMHPHETQHTFQEIAPLLEENGFSVHATSINQFKSNPSYKKITMVEKKLEKHSKAALYKKGRYVPGFFTIWARKDR